MAKRWNEMNFLERMALLEIVYPSRSASLWKFEAKLKWGKLLPSTQKDIENYWTRGEIGRI